jgi:hypothetical protein
MSRWISGACTGLPGDGARSNHSSEPLIATCVSAHPGCGGDRGSSSYALNVYVSGLTGSGLRRSAYQHLRKLANYYCTSRKWHIYYRCNQCATYKSSSEMLNDKHVREDF